MNGAGLLAEKSHELGRQLQEQVDVALILAIDGFLGRMDWTLEELRGRLLLRWQGRVETYCIDGIPLLRVGPVEWPQPRNCSWSTEGDNKFFLTASRSIERLYPPKTPIVQL